MLFPGGPENIKDHLITCNILKGCSEHRYILLILLSLRDSYGLIPEKAAGFIWETEVGKIKVKLKDC